MSDKVKQLTTGEEMRYDEVEDKYYLVNENGRVVNDNLPNGIEILEE